MSDSDATAVFVHRQNIERYRKLLQSPLDPERRRSIVDLLAQEEAAVREIDDRQAFAREQDHNFD
jgi:hypothetical protein